MVAMLAFGGTYAYFTATATEKTTTFTTGSVKLVANDATFTANLENVVPGDALTTGALTLTTTSAGTDSYVAIKFVISATKGGETVELTGTSLENATALLSTSTGVTGATWQNAGDNVYVLGSDASTASAVQTATTVNITDGVLTFEAEADWGNNGAAEAEPELMNATITITISARSIQVKNLDIAEGSDAVAQVKTELFA